MSKELTNKNWVVITRGTGRHYVSEDGKNYILKLKNAQNHPEMIEVNDSYLALSDIIGIVTASKLEEIDKQKNGEWRCERGNWHKRGEICKCGWGNYTPTQIEDEQRTEVEKERATIIGDLVERGFRIRDLPTLKGLTNEELQAKLTSYKR